MINGLSIEKQYEMFNYLFNSNDKQYLGKEGDNKVVTISIPTVEVYIFQKIKQTRSGHDLQNEYFFIRNNID